MPGARVQAERSVRIGEIKDMAELFSDSEVYGPDRDKMQINGLKVTIDGEPVGSTSHLSETDTSRVVDEDGIAVELPEDAEIRAIMDDDGNPIEIRITRK